jgi:hypothetical protein
MTYRCGNQSTMARHGTALAAVIATLFVAIRLGVPMAAFFLSHPLPAGPWLVVLIPNAVLFVGVSIGVFFATRALPPRV